MDMQRRITPHWNLVDLFVSLLVLGLLLWFTFTLLVRVPYAGFYFNPRTGQVVDVFVEATPANLLQEGDTIQQVGDVSWDSFRSDATQGFFAGNRRGQKVDISVIRNGHVVAVQWPFPGFNVNEFETRLLNIWWAGYFFWFFGFVTQVLIRPRNALRRLMITANYLTGLWLVCGTLSGTHVGGSALILRAVTWLMLPVYLNLHWEFPKPLANIPKPAWLTLYSICGVLALMELFQFLPSSLYAVGFLTALLGSLILLLAHFVWQKAHRRDVGLLFISMLIALMPSISLGVLYTLGFSAEVGALSLLILPIMPASYFFVIYRRQLGGLELRANRIISMYSYLILLSTVLLLLTVPATSFSTSPEVLIVSGVIMSLAVAFFSILSFPRYQAFVERRLLGIKLPYQKLLETYSDRITTSASLTSLTQLLEDEILPSLLVRQFAFLHISKGQGRLLMAIGLTEEELPQLDEVAQLMEQSGRYLSGSSIDKQLPSWIRLVLPLTVDGSIIGLWLLGRQDPDDVYSQAEVPILQSLANQTAIALSNIHQTDQLRMLYQENINRHEQERMRLARELHDSVLNEMAVLSLSLDQSTAHPKFREAYEGLTQQLREIVGDLRPPMLQYGLKPAFEELAYNLMDWSKDSLRVETDIQADEVRYPENLELHVYRIVQEAVKNALQHGSAKTIRLYVQLKPTMIELTVEDDGVGFEIEGGLELESLLASKHFGLAGIVERCRLIQAEMKIESWPRQGTRLRVRWSQDR